MELRASDGRVIALEVVGDHDGTPVLLCHGLADSRLSARWLEQAARELGLLVIAPDRPGTGGTDRHWLRHLADWADDAAMVLDALQVDSARLLGVSGGGPYAAACAARIPARVRSLMLVCPLGLPEWPTDGMARGERLSLALATHAPEFGGWSLGRLAALARRSPDIYLWLAATNLADVDVRALQHPEMRQSFIDCYLEAFRRGYWGAAQDLRLLTGPWGFDLGSITAPTSIHHGDADSTVPVQHACRYAKAIPGAQLHIHHGEGHISILSHPQDILTAFSS
jgi:pimeloyl-ACP methyl ester carboxylesterase